MEASVSTQLSRLTLFPSPSLPHNRNTTLRLFSTNPQFILRSSFLRPAKSPALSCGWQKGPPALDSSWGVSLFNGVVEAHCNVQIVVREDEPEESVLQRFRREVSKAGIIKECRRRRFFENTQEVKKRKAREAGRRNRRKRLEQSKPPPSLKDSSPSRITPEDEDDNWELPEGDLPY